MSTTTLKTLEKAVELLWAIADGKSSSSVDELAAKVRLPKSTTYRFLKTLQSKGMVDASSKYGRYHLGSALYFLSQAVPRQGSLPDHAVSVMRRLTEETGETSFLCVKTGVETTCIECIESPQAIITRYDVGKVRPLHVGAASKVILAFLPDLEIETILRGELRKITDNTITSPSKLQKEIERIRRSGYAYSDQELIIGARAISAPVFDSDGSISASVTISAPISRLRNSNRAKIANLVTKAGKQISRAIELKT